MIKLLFISIFAISLNGYDILKIDNTLSIKNTLQCTYYINDENQILTPKMVLNNNSLKHLNSMNQGITIGPFWTRTELKNTTNSIQSVYLKNLLAGTNKIDVYIYINHQLIKKYMLGDLRDINKKDIKYRLSVFNLILKPSEHIILVSRIENYGFYNLGWVIQSTKHFLEYESNITLSYGFFTGFILFYLFYALILFNIHKETAYLMLLFEVFFTTLYNFSLHGFLYRLNLNLNLEFLTAVTWTSPMLASIFFILFPYYFFNLKKYHPKLTKATFAVVLIYVLLFIYLLYAQFIDNSKFEYYKSLSIIHIFYSIFLFSIAIYMIKQKKMFANYYMFGQILVILTIFIFSLGHYGILELRWYYQFLIPIGNIIDSIILLYIQYKKSNAIHIDIIQKRELMLEQSRFYTIGQALGNITHQWKQPLAHIGYSITMLEATHQYNRKDLNKEFESVLPQIKYDISHMQSILNDFVNYYQTSFQKESFNPKTCINQKLLVMIKAKLMLKHVTVSLNIDENLKLITYEHIFSNILLTLIDNSLNHFQENNNNINIEIVKNNNKIIINYKDNAGGITITPIETVFKPFVTDKIEGNNSGLGLSIVKMLVEDKLNGTISVKNADNGILFKIIFKQ